MHRATKESELTTQSADGSMAKGTTVALGYHRRPPRRLDKMSLLMEVRIATRGTWAACPTYSFPRRLLPWVRQLI